MSEEDWKRLLGEVTPLKSKRVRVEAKAHAKPAQPAKKKRAQSQPAAPPSSAEIAAKLDLHGMTLAVAHERLCGFIETQRHLGARRVLVITGKSGELASEVPRWLTLSSLSRHVLVVGLAGPRHGGNGALYVDLKRKKS